MTMRTADSQTSPVGVFLKVSGCVIDSDSEDSDGAFALYLGVVASVLHNITCLRLVRKGRNDLNS